MPIPRGRQNHKPCPFLALPLELLDAIGSDLEEDPDRASDPHALSALAATCKAFRGHFRLRGVRQQLLDAVVSGGTRSGRDERQRPVYCFEDATEGQFGWAPFFLYDVEKEGHKCIPLLPGDYIDPSKYDGTLRLSLLAHSPNFNEGPSHNNRLAFTWTACQINLIEDTALEIVHCFYPGQSPDDKEIDWDDDLAGRLKVVTPALLRERFVCAECDGSEEVRVTSQDVYRYDLVSINSNTTEWDFTLSFLAPCPRCTIELFSFSELGEHYNKLEETAKQRLEDEMADKAKLALEEDRTSYLERNASVDDEE